MGKLIIMYSTAMMAESLRNQLNKSHLQFHECNRLIKAFNDGEQDETDSEIIYSIEKLKEETRAEGNSS